MEQIPKNKKPQTQTYTERKNKQNQQIKDTITKTPNITLKKLNEKLSLCLTEDGLSSHLKKMGFSFKKRRSMQTTKKETT